MAVSVGTPKQSPVSFDATLLQEQRKVGWTGIYKVTVREGCTLQLKQDGLTACNDQQKEVLSIDRDRLIGLAPSDQGTPKVAKLLSFSGDDAKMTLCEHALEFASEQECSDARFALLQSLNSGLKNNKIVAVVNPAKAGGKGESVWEKSKVILEAAGIEVLDTCITENNDATIAYLKGRQEEFCRLSQPPVYLAVGGDGTIQAIINGCTEMGAKPKDVAVGTIPIGGAHGVAASLDLKDANATDYANYSFLQAARRNVHQDIYPLLCVSENRKGEILEQRLAMNGVDGAFIRDVDLAAAEAERKGANKAFATYKKAVSFIAHPPSYRYQVTISSSPGEDAPAKDGAKIETFHLVAALNIPFAGFGYHLAPAVHSDKPEFVFRAIKQGGLPSFFWRPSMIGNLGRPDSTYENTASCTRATEMRITKVDDKDKEAAFTVDGEAVVAHSLHIKIWSQPIHMVALGRVAASF